MSANANRHISRCLVQRKFLMRVLRQLIDEGSCYGGYAFRDVLGPAVCDCAHCKAVRLLKKADELDAAELNLRL